VRIDPECRSFGGLSQLFTAFSTECFLDGGGSSEKIRLNFLSLLLNIRVMPGPPVGCRKGWVGKPAGTFQGIAHESSTATSLGSRGFGCADGRSAFIASFAR
jgi:hypothetical protein